MNSSQTTIIPTPKEFSGGEKKAALPQPEIYMEHPQWKGAVRTFCRCAEKMHGIPFREGMGGVSLVLDAQMPEGHYCLETGEKTILRASGGAGMGYALATLLQIIEVRDGEILLPDVKIEDYPDKPYRALMVDLARRWHPFRTLLSYVDLCFLYKISHLHLHFMDNESYTLPSGAFSGLPAKQKHYSEKEIRQLRTAAQEAGVTLIPELEAPGHAVHLIETYPEQFGNALGGFQADGFVNEAGHTIAGKEGVICAGSEAAMKGMEILLDEICGLFPEAPYLHIGGDEAHISLWEHCGTCREYRKRHGIGSVEELYADFVGRLADMVLARGKTPIVWEGFSKEYAARISKETIVIAWESHYQMAYDLLEAGFRVINSSWQPLYIVPDSLRRWSAYDILKWDVYNWQHWWEKSEACLNPIHVTPTDQVIGAQLCAWECTYEQEILFVVENLAALSERTWSLRRKCGGAQFYQKLQAATALAVSLL